MSINQLEHAIALIKQGKPIEAQKLLKTLIAADPHDLPAWFWFVETCSTNKQRLNVLEICMEYNPDSEQVKQALDKFRTLPTQQLSTQLLSVENKINPKTSQDDGLYLYLLLIGLSVISALLIAFINPVPRGEWGLGEFIILIILQSVQWILVIPATMAVNYVFSLLSKKFTFNSIHYLIRYGIPLIINILGASYLSIVFFVADLQSAHHNSFLSKNVVLTIKNESITPWHGYESRSVNEYAYQVALQVKNTSGEEIPQMIFFLGAYEKDDFNFPWGSDHGIGYQQLTFYEGQNTIPLGDSEIIINIPVHKIDLQCNNPNLAKPLYLLYSIGEQYTSIEVGNSINKRLLQIACD